MPKNKEAYLRYLIIHSQVKRNAYNPGYPTKEDILNELEDQGYGITGSQLEKDISFLRNEKGAPLEYNRAEKCYRYTEPWDFDISLSPDDVRMLNMAIHKLEIFSEAPEFRAVKDSIDRLSKLFNLSRQHPDDKTDKYILFEYSKGFRGGEYLSVIYDAIFEKKVINFTHCKYDCEKPTLRELHPYTLKEHRNRWYVIGIEKGRPRIFGLDRITNLVVTDKYFLQDPEFYDEIFNVLKDAVGVMAFSFKSQPVVLHFEKEEANYVRSLMLHRSQEITSTDPDGGITVHLNVKITPEFITECILPYGNRVKVLSPPSLVKKVKEIYTGALEKYGTKHVSHLQN
jgi:predicted DNA-binding transcriptional regulator YafY